jgi:16S rRNA (guanine527-N7)-methyltransferase
MLGSLYRDWNDKINVISRKDIDNIYLNHVLHSLAIAKIISFKDGTVILDAGTGGGFPGIPLAILFPRSEFHLVDSVKKKIKVANAVATSVNLNNIMFHATRVEDLNIKTDFVISRAVTSLPRFYSFVQKLISVKSFNSLQNGVLYLKGGEFAEELKTLKAKNKTFNISGFFSEDFFQTKKIVHIFN